MEKTKSVGDLLMRLNLALWCCHLLAFRLQSPWVVNHTIAKQSTVQRLAPG